jgi:hypothetical protein
MQLQMFDPRMTPIRTAEVLGDIGLCRAIDSMRPRRRIGAAWPYVERLCEVEGKPVWAVEDGGKAARQAFARLDAGAA